jgi:hypothetical protein
VTQLRQAHGAGGSAADARDPWLLSAFAVALIAGWSFLEDWALAAGEASNVDREQVRQQFHEVVESLVRTEAGLRSLNPATRPDAGPG